MNRRDNPNSSVNSKEKVYCMNVEHDYIREILMAKGNEELWERFKYYYTYKRYGNYMVTLGRISDAFKREYVERIGKEFKRADEMGEVDMSVFPPEDQERLGLLIANPGDFYYKYILVNDAEVIRNSTTFKVGKIIMFIPIKIKLAIKKIFK